MTKQTVIELDANDKIIVTYGDAQVELWATKVGTDDVLHVSSDNDVRLVGVRVSNQMKQDTKDCPIGTSIEVVQDVVEFSIIAFN